jgi:hypothetical protein
MHDMFYFLKPPERPNPYHFGGGWQTSDIFGNSISIQSEELFAKSFYKAKLH